MSLTVNKLEQNLLNEYQQRFTQHIL